MFESGQEVYFLFEDRVATVKLLAKQQSFWIIALDGVTFNAREEYLTTSINEVIQYINGRIDKYEGRIAVLKAKLQGFPPLRLTHE